MKEIFDIFKSPKILLFLKDRSISFLWFFMVVFFIVILVSFLNNSLGFEKLLIFWLKIKYIIILFLILLWSFYFLFKYRFLIINDCDNLWNQLKIWIIVAIDDKNDYEWFTLKYDFINSLNENLDNTKFKIIILPKVYLNEIYKDKNNLNWDFIKKINKKIKWHYFIGWKVEKVKDWWLRCYLRTNAMVFHKNIPKNVQTELSTDFNNLYPRDISFEENWYKTWIDFSWEYSSIVARYMIGVAFLISNNPFWAIELHRKLHFELEKVKKNEKIKSTFNEKYVEHIWEKIKIIQFHELRLLVNFFYRKKDNINWINYLNEWSELSDFYNFIDWNLLAQQWIYEFLVNKDILKSRKLIKRSSCFTSDKTHKYSLIFLDLYDREYRLAKNRMKDILKKKQFRLEKISVEEVIYFMDDVIIEFNDRFEFLYWQSLLYYKKLRNIPMAYEKIIRYIDNKWIKNFEYEIIDPNVIRRELEKIMKL